jgi:nucleoside-diphosphate-sugar epimerase
MVQTVLVIGGTGRQGSAIVQKLANTKSYSIKVITRDPNAKHAQALAELHGVSLIQGDSHDDATLREAFKGVDVAYVNTNGFILGQKNELYWGIRTFELAAEAGVKHYIWAGLPYVYKRSGYNPKYQVGHLDGKGRVNGTFQMADCADIPRFHSCSAY